MIDRVRVRYPEVLSAVQGGDSSEGEDPSSQEGVRVLKTCRDNRSEVPWVSKTC